MKTINKAQSENLSHNIENTKDREAINKIMDKVLQNRLSSPENSWAVLSLMISFLFFIAFFLFALGRYLLGGVFFGILAYIFSN